MKKEVFILMFVIVLVMLSVSLVLSDFTKGDKLYYLDPIYGPSQAITGWINISLEDEPANSLLTGFDDSIELKDFLEKNSVFYSCSPNDCESSYSSYGIGLNSKTFTINYDETKTLGIKLTGQITGISSLSFDISTNAGKSCLHPLQIDLLDDGIIDWKAESVSNDFSCVLSNNYGCWDQADYIPGQEFLITDSLYCEKIDLLSPAKNFEIGAEILEITGGNVDFKLSIDAGIDSGECIVSASAEGKISCNIEFNEPLEDPVQAEVCLSVDDLNDNGKYQIKYEEAFPCGSAGSQAYDFPIFVNPGKYGAVSDFTFNQNLIDDGNTGITLADEIWYYINDKYNGNCEPECIVPIKFYPGISQTTTISGTNLIYEKGGSLQETKISDVSETPSLINTDFQELDLEKGNFLTPEDYGNEEFVLELGGKEIFSKEIDIEPVPEIKTINPNTLPALVNVKFTIILGNSGTNLTYIWDFGDGSGKEISNTNVIKHMYPDIGTYEVAVKVINQHGESSKLFQVNVISPKDSINETIEKYEKNLGDIETKLNSLPLWIKTEIEKKVDLSSLKTGINLQKKAYEDAFADSHYVDIMVDLLELKIPYSFNATQLINQINFFPKEEQLNLEVLEDFGAGDAFELKEKYYNAINNWLQQNLEMILDSKTYSFSYEDSKIEDLTSYVKIILKPKNDLEEFYLIVNGNPNEIIFNNIETKVSGEIARGVIFSELSEDKTIEFLYPGKIEFASLPIYFSPELKNLDTGIVSGVCNSNGKCEKEKGESSKNCRVDCKPIGWTFLLLFGVLFGAFVIYIILQEWYKKHYESRLFPSKNQFFNLINFMSNSVNQGVEKANIFKKLKPLGWINEQLVYAWKKLHGKRTGMWEIPIFRRLEKKKIEKEIKKRTNKSSIIGLDLK